MLQRIITYIVFFIAISISFSQAQVTITIRGEVINAKNNEPLAFVNILVDDGNQGTTSDIDGKFSLEVPLDVKKMTFSYVGFEHFTYEVKEKADLKPLYRPLRIKLVEKPTEIDEVVIQAGENPAHPIIRKASQNRRKNNPEKIKSFRYKTYNKFYVTLGNASVSRENITKKKTDSTELRILNFFEKRHLFFSESVIEKKYIAPNYNKATVIANRISGFRSPSIIMASSDFQPFSFYGEYIEILNKKYLNPISTGSTEQYFFHLEDSLCTKSGSIYIISFTPLLHKNFEGLEGTLYINSKGYAIQNVRAKSLDTNGKVSFKLEQKYELFEDKYWFPSQLHADVTFNELKVGSKSYAGIVRSYVSDIEILPPLRKRDFDEVTLEFEASANEQSEEFWEKRRYIALNRKEQETYTYLDSLGKKQKFDTFMRVSEVLSVGRVGIGVLDLDIRKALQYNQKEGFRFNLGLHTNDKISDRFSVGGYLGYGTRDGIFKYGFSGLLDFQTRFDIRLGTSFRKDVIEPASLQFIGEQRIGSTERARNFLISRMDRIERFEGFVFFRPFRDTQAKISLNRTFSNPQYAYRYFSENDIHGKSFFNFTELNFQLHYAFRTNYMQIRRHNVFSGAKYPVVGLNFTQGFSDVFGGDFDYQKIELQAGYARQIRKFGESRLQIQAGQIIGDAPYMRLYNGRGSFDRDLPVIAEKNFQTMRIYEFLADRFIHVFYTHNFGRLLYRSKVKWFQPELELMQAVGWGSLENPERHQLIDFQTHDQGYFESGIMINKLLRANYLNVAFLDFGVGGFYRYGAYSLGSFKDNFALKFNLGFSF